MTHSDRLTLNLPHLVLASLLLLTATAPEVALSQLTRERVETDAPLEIFPSPLIVGMSSAGNLAGGNLYTSVTHTFGRLDGGIDHFFGLDDGANTRIGLDYGFSDRFSMGISRMTFLKVVDLRGKVTLQRQTVTGGSPVEMTLKGSVSISTLSGTGDSFSERLVYFISLPTARKFDQLSLQIAPMFAHFNSVSQGGEEQLLALGLAGSYRLSQRFSLGLEYLPVLSTGNPGTRHAMAVVLDIETGGHIFQLFLASSQWHNEPYILANNTDRFIDGEFRFGFTIHRVFGL